MQSEAAVPAPEPEAAAGWFISQLWRRPVVDVRAIERLGQVADIVFDAATPKKVRDILKAGQPVAAARIAPASRWVYPTGFGTKSSLNGLISLRNQRPSRLPSQLLFLSPLEFTRKPQG